MDGVRVPSTDQLKMLALWADGKSFGQIAEQEYVSHRTVRWRLGEVRRKVGADTLSHALVICIACGYVCIDGRDGVVFVPEDLDVLVA